MADDQSTVDHYDSQYSQFASRLYEEIRSDTFGEDIGQNGWLTREEHDLFLSWLDLNDSSRLLDVACGSGGPTLRVAAETGCTVHGLDIHADAIAAARTRAEAQGLTDRATFEQADAADGIQMPDASFDAIICTDAINHLPNRLAVLTEWARLLRPGGSIVFTDPVVVTGPLTNEELAIRSSIGFFLFVPRGADEHMLAEAGFDILRVEDRSVNMARVAEAWRAAREARANELRKVEGANTFSGQQRFFETSATIAREGRLSRFAFHARKKTATT